MDALSFDDGQLHRREQKAAARFVALDGAHGHAVETPDSGACGGFTPTSGRPAVTKYRSRDEIVTGMPVTFVSAWNAVPSLRSAWAKVLTALGIRIGIKAFVCSGKLERQGLRLGQDNAETLTSYKPSREGVEYLRRDACSPRLQGLVKNGVEDPARYKVRALA